MTVYDSTRSQSAVVDEFRELVQYRDLLVQLVSRNIKTRYKRSVLGLAWTMLNPLLMMAVMSVVFSGIFKVGVEHYPVYVLSGLILWNFFAQTTTNAIAELVWGGALLTRIYVPRAIFATSALGTDLVNLVIALVPLLLIALVTGVGISPAILILPVPIVLVAMFALGIGLLLSTLAVYFPDVKETYQVVLTAWMYLTPIIYPIDIIAEGDRWLFNLNPMYHMVEIFRAPIYYGRLPAPEALLAATAAAGLSLALGWYVFTRKRDEFAYRV